MSNARNDLVQFQESIHSIVSSGQSAVDNGLIPGGKHYFQEEPPLINQAKDSLVTLRTLVRVP